VQHRVRVVGTNRVILLCIRGERSDAGHRTAQHRSTLDCIVRLRSYIAAPVHAACVAVSVDRFDGLYPLDNWTAEIGARKQLTPQLVGDLGVGRGFIGSTQATTMNFGLSYAAPLRWPW